MALDPARWTLKTQEAMQAAIDAARAASNPETTPEHLLLAMLGQEGTAALPVLQKVGIAPLSLRNRLTEAVERLPRSYGGARPPPGPAPRRPPERARRPGGGPGGGSLAAQ